MSVLAALGSGLQHSLIKERLLSFPELDLSMTMFGVAAETSVSLKQQAPEQLLQDENEGGTREKWQDSYRFRMQWS